MTKSLPADKKDAYVYPSGHRETTPATNLVHWRKFFSENPDVPLPSWYQAANDILSLPPPTCDSSDDDDDDDDDKSQEDAAWMSDGDSDATDNAQVKKGGPRGAGSGVKDDTSKQMSDLLDQLQFTAGGATVTEAFQNLTRSLPDDAMVNNCVNIMMLMVDAANKYEDVKKNPEIGLYEVNEILVDIGRNMKTSMFFFTRGCAARLNKPQDRQQLGTLLNYAIDGYAKTIKHLNMLVDGYLSQAASSPNESHIHEDEKIFVDQIQGLGASTLEQLSKYKQQLAAMNASSNTKGIPGHSGIYNFLMKSATKS